MAWRRFRISRHSNILSNERPLAQATGAQVEWDRVDAGIVAERKTGKYLPETVYESLARTSVGLKSPVGTPIASGRPKLPPRPHVAWPQNPLC